MLAASDYFYGPIDKITRRAEENFFAGIKLSNNTFKTTASDRMPDVDAAVVRNIHARQWQKPAVLDVGVSSGVTTGEFMAAMTASGLAPAMTATDFSVNANLYAVTRGVRLLADRAGDPLQYEFLGVGIRAWNRRIDYLTGYWLLTALARRFVRGRPLSLLGPVRLVSRRELAKAVFDIVEDDVTVANPQLAQRFDVVRAANLLNRSYFDAATLRRSVDHLKSYTRGPGSLLVICRTHLDGSNHGTIFEVLPGNALRVVERIGNGSEIEDLLVPAA
jgi:hypothetical protein